MYSMHISKAVLLWMRAHLVLLAKMPLMLIVKRKTLPQYHAQRTRYTFSHQLTHSTALIAYVFGIFFEFIGMSFELVLAGKS